MPTVAERQFYIYVEQFLQDSFPKDSEWALWPRDCNTTMTIYTGDTPKDRYSLRDQMFFLNWHLLNFFRAQNWHM